MESRESAELLMVGPAGKVDGRAQALVGPGLATPLRKCESSLAWPDPSFAQGRYRLQYKRGLQAITPLRE